MIHPTQDVTAMKDPRMQHVIDAMWQLEGDIYQVAQNKVCLWIFMGFFVHVNSFLNNKHLLK